MDKLICECEMPEIGDTPFNRPHGICNTCDRPMSKDNQAPKEQNDSKNPTQPIDTATAVKNFKEISDIDHARRVTACYVGDLESSNIIKEEFWDLFLPDIDITFGDWNPHTDYNQVMMVVEKMYKDGLIWKENTVKHDKGFISRVFLADRLSFFYKHEKKIIAILFAVTKALEKLNQK